MNDEIDITITIGTKKLRKIREFIKNDFKELTINIEPDDSEVEEYLFEVLTYLLAMIKTSDKLF
jgi:hypothetical protein